MAVISSKKFTNLIIITAVIITLLAIIALRSGFID